ncbi:hypothetical protein [Caulobacter sp. 1776]|uniref:hypothetical protein n=1 Tax=Caulobacter sp. 1776 TaxID=3156420 RepID=UPI003398E414
MRKFVLSTLAATLMVSVAAPALAASERWTDGQFLQANRCLALAQSSALGALPADDLAAQIKSQTFGRGSNITDRGTSLQAEASRQSKTKDEIRRAKLLAEREGVCKTYLTTQVAAS